MAKNSFKHQKLLKSKKDSHLHGSDKQFQMLTLQSHETINFVISSKKINIHNNPQERNKAKQKHETKKNKTK